MNYYNRECYTNRIEGSRLSEDQTRYIFETNTINVEPGEAASVDDIIDLVECRDQLQASLARAMGLNAGMAMNEMLCKKEKIIMKYSALYDYLPKLAVQETSVIQIAEDDLHDIPPDNYGLIEYYCIEPGCDCRRVMLHVMSARQQRFVAVVNFGWENRKFYEDWYGRKDKAMIEDLKGPILNAMSYQAPYALKLLTVIQDIVLSDPEQVNRLKRHYTQFKRKVSTE